MLGVLNEALVRLSTQPDIRAFWVEVCRSSRWLIPAQRLCIALAPLGAELMVIARCSADQVEVADRGALTVADDAIGAALNMPRASFVRGPWDDSRPVDAEREWLLEDDPPLVLQVPIESRQKVVGRMLFAMSAVREADEKALLASAKSYALYVGVTHVMLNTLLDRATVSDRLMEKNTELEGTQDELRKQLAVVHAQHEAMLSMSTPIIRVWNRVLTLPIIGKVDSDRALRMIDELLGAVARDRARFTILDLTGAGDADASTLTHLLKMAEMVKLLGSACLLSGIPSAMARSLVGLGIELGDTMTFGTLQAALQYAMSHRDRAR